MLTFLICDTAVAVLFQTIVNCCAEIFVLVIYLYLVIVIDRQWDGGYFLKSMHMCLIYVEFRQKYDLAHNETESFNIDP